MLYVDIPSQQEIKLLNKRRADACISIYIPTTPLTQQAGNSQTELRNLSKCAIDQLRKDGFDKRRLDLIQERIDELLDDTTFWQLMANSLAVLVTPDDLRTYRLANNLQERLEVSDRFSLKPLLRSITFPHTAIVLAISENAARLVEVSADYKPQEISVQALPKDAANAVNKSTLNSRSATGRIQGSEGQKVRLAQYSRIVDAAIRPILVGLDVPLVLAASEPLASIYRSVNSFPGLLVEGILHTDDRTSLADLASAVTPVLDQHYADDLEAMRQVYQDRVGSGRACNEIDDVAKAATFGAVETLLIDIDAAVPGTIDEQSGVLLLAKEKGPSTYDVIDEIAGRALNSGAKVLAVRSQDIPQGGPVAAILRYKM